MRDLAKNTLEGVDEQRRSRLDQPEKPHERQEVSRYVYNKTKAQPNDLDRNSGSIVIYLSFVKEKKVCDMRKRLFLFVPLMVVLGLVNVAALVTALLSQNLWMYAGLFILLVLTLLVFYLFDVDEQEHQQVLSDNGKTAFSVYQ